MNTFEPSSDLIQEEDCNTLLLYLPGFTKEQLRVQLTRTRVLKISGSRPIGDKWSSFQKDFPVPENCDPNKITAKFEDGILYVRQPKLIVPAERDDEKIPPSQTPQPQEPAGEPPAPKIDQERQPPTLITPPNVDDSKQSGVKDLPDKSVEKKEEKSSEEKEKVSESEGGKKDERSYVEEETGGVDDDDDRKVAAARRDSDEREKISGTKVSAAAEVDEYNKVINAAAKLKMARENMMRILLFLFALALGLYISNLPWFSRKVED